MLLPHPERGAFTLRTSRKDMIIPYKIYLLSILVYQTRINVEIYGLPHVLLGVVSVSWLSGFLGDPSTASTAIRP